MISNRNSLTSHTTAVAFFIALFLAAAQISPAQAAKPAPTKPDWVLQKIFDTFHRQKIKTMVYDEVRTVATKLNSHGEDKGLMPLDKKNSSTYTMRTFYKSPDKHGYRMLSTPIDGFWPGSPKQQNAILMDERWMESVRASYKLVLSPSRKVRGRDCFVLNLVPKPGIKYIFPMTWFVDKKTFNIIKFMHLVRGETGSVSTTGEIDYANVRGHVVPIKSRWTTVVSNVLYLFEYYVRYENYLFNVPLDNSVFETQPMPAAGEQKQK